MGNRYICPMTIHGDRRKRGGPIQFFYWLVLLMLIGFIIFALQNSSAPPVVIKFLFWRVETSLLYTLLGSVAAGILIALSFCLPKLIRSSFPKRPSNEYQP